MRHCIAILLVLALHILQAQAQTTWLGRVESMLKKSYFGVDIDTAYIIRPRQRWSLRFSQNIAGTGIEAESRIDGLQQVTHLEADLRATFTLGIRYSGLALALSVNPAHLRGKNNDIELNMNAYGNRYGIDLIGVSTRTLAGTITTADSQSDIAAGLVHQQALYANAYYALNRRRFSYPAAFSQSYIQKASAGSWLLGMSYFYTRVTTDQNSSLANAPSQLILHNVGLGGGYAYNWVPARRWLLHLSALPTFVVYSYSRLTIGDDRTKMLTQFPEVIITGRGAVVYNMKHTFVGGSMVYTFSSNGKQDYLMVKNQKWRVRAFFGIRL